MLNTSLAAASETMADIVSDIKEDTAWVDQSNRPGTRLGGLPPWMFNLNGIFLGLLGEPPDQVRSIVLVVDTLVEDDLAGEPETIAIELPTNLQAAVKQSLRQRSLRLGDRVRCIGRSQLDYAANVVQLKAYCLFSESATILPAATPTVQTGSSTQTVPSAQAALTTPSPQKQKILVCHKSGCKKRGGRQLALALEQALQTYQLQDRVEIQYTGCQKCCSKAPALTIMPGKHRYYGLNPQDLPSLIEKHFCELH
ncbi:(2Fe-2S) ferredoxin domain-containing protein [cf. Phormidesmis sp. LEGE 11477]|uniref:(2Fe-2S) ferredoxin domain-containing protein n=1 Tax=cf. Phormidesmis sp. LEGE 11477 TaxID=1828680 RepID=UPI0018824037|nr:(2Fe-2S) ferredoxin domain-containing protein [cf. Phormidesmis sp. LEGE 11477]MBE9059857.1 (2Fe-2S) ferredoxin domain-containing protein [cf. Phormidesmis sp. LEGE 11477]